jgi:hypothetical protein
MAHFALLDENNVVQQVAVVSEKKLEGFPQPVPQEVIDNRTFLRDVPGRWVQTSYNGSFRKNYAAINHKYDEQRDAFIAPQPFASWVLNEDTCRWEAPMPYPNDGEDYEWNEENLTWVLTTEN